MKLVVMVNGKPEGPFELEALKDAVRRGEISPLALGWHEGQESWTELHRMPQIQSMLDSEPEVAMRVLPPPERALTDPGPATFPTRVLVKAHDEIRGPYTFAQLKDEISAGRISLSDLGRIDGASGWLALKNIPEVLDVVLPPIPQLCEVCELVPAAAPVMNGSTEEPVPPQPPHKSGTNEKDLAAIAEQPTANVLPETLPVEPSSSSHTIPIGAGASITLANPRSRLFAQLAEFAIGFILMILFGGAGAVLGATSEQLGIMTIAYLLLWFVVNSVLVATRGQTVGKMVFGIQIVDFQTGHPGGARMLLLRYWTLILLSWLSFAGPVFSLVWILAFVCDSLFIFRRDHRCLHDLVARTCVIQCGRPLLSSNLQPQCA